MRLITQPAFLLVTFWGHFVIISGAIAFFHFESSNNPNIKNWLDALYWSIATVTTVGYGDVSPLTMGGKIVAIIMMILGSIFLWSYTGLLVSGLISPEIESVEAEVRGVEKNIKSFSKENIPDSETTTQLIALIQELRAELRNQKTGPKS